MQNYNFNSPFLTVYPGNYVPKYSSDEIKQELKKCGDTFLYPIKMKELKDLYQIEIEIPGSKSEDFILQIDDNVLSICMLHKEVEHFDGENFRMKNLKSVCVSKKIILPNDTDSFFTAAECREGVLHLIFPKTTELNKNIHINVVVY